MHVKVDEDISPIAASWLQEKGYEASTVVDQGMGGWKDDPLWRKVLDDRQFLLTADKGFGDIRVYPPGTHGASCCCDLTKMASTPFSVCSKWF